MAKTRKNKNRLNTNKLDVCVVSTSVALIFICFLFCLGGGLFIRHGNTSLNNKILEAEDAQNELIIKLNTAKGNLEPKQNIKGIQIALQSHGVDMYSLRTKQCYVKPLDETKRPVLTGQQVVAYNNK